MADNVESNPGSGGVVWATDDIAGVHRARVKIQHGADGSATDVSTTSPMPVQLRDSDGTDVGLSAALATLALENGGVLDAIAALLAGTLAIAGTVTANAGTNLNTSLLALEGGGNLATLAGVVSAARAAVNLIAGQAGITGGAGAVGASTPRTTLASDDPAVVALQIIDDWDESDRAKVNPIAGQVGVAGGAGAVSALTQRVVMANSFGKTIKLAVVSLTASGNIVAAAGASKSIRVFALAVQSRNDSMTLQITNGSGGSALSIRWAFNTREGVSRSVAVPSHICNTSDNTALYATITGTGTIDIEVTYWDDDAA